MGKKESNPDPTFKKPPPPPAPPPARHPYGLLKVSPPRPWPDLPEVKDDGGFLVPEVIRVHKKGVLARIARTISHSYGWEDFRLADELTKFVKRNQEENQ